MVSKPDRPNGVPSFQALSPADLPCAAPTRLARSVSVFGIRQIVFLFLFQAVVCALICLVVRSYVDLRLPKFFVFLGSCMLLTFKLKELVQFKTRTFRRQGWSGQRTVRQGVGAGLGKTGLRLIIRFQKQHNRPAHTQRIVQICCANLLLSSNVLFSLV